MKRVSHHAEETPRKIRRHVHSEVARALRMLASRLTEGDIQQLKRRVQEEQVDGPTSRIWTHNACILTETVVVLDVKSAYWERLGHMGIPAIDAVFDNLPKFSSLEKQFRTVFYGTACKYKLGSPSVNEAVQNMATLARLQNTAFVRRLEEELRSIEKDCVVMVSTDSVAFRLDAVAEHFGTTCPLALAEQLSEEGGTLKVESIFSHMIVSGTANLWVGLEKSGKVVARPRKILEWSGAEETLRRASKNIPMLLQTIPTEALELRQRALGTVALL
jgi:hypothetical protein